MSQNCSESFNNLMPLRPNLAQGMNDRRTSRRKDSAFRQHKIENHSSALTNWIFQNIPEMSSHSFRFEVFHARLLRALSQSAKASASNRSRYVRLLLLLGGRRRRIEARCGGVRILAKVLSGIGGWHRVCGDEVVSDETSEWRLRNATGSDVGQRTATRIVKNFLGKR